MYIYMQGQVTYLNVGSRSSTIEALEVANALPGLEYSIEHQRHNLSAKMSQLQTDKTQRLQLKVQAFLGV